MPPVKQKTHMTHGDMTCILCIKSFSRIFIKLVQDDQVILLGIWWFIQAFVCHSTMGQVNDRA